MKYGVFCCVYVLVIFVFMSCNWCMVVCCVWVVIFSVIIVMYYCGWCVLVCCVLI